MSAFMMQDELARLRQQELRAEASRARTELAAQRAGRARRVVTASPGRIRRAVRWLRAERPLRPLGRAGI